MRHTSRGFTMISILITVAIIGILMVTQLKSMNSATRGLMPGGGSASVQAPSFANATIINQLRQIHMMELTYQQRYGHFATFEELVKDGSIPNGYSAREDDPQGVAFVRYYDLEVHAAKETYLILAFPNSQAATEFSDRSLPAYRIDETGEVREEEGLGDPMAPADEIPAAEDLGGLLGGGADASAE